MRLSDIKGDEALDVLADILEPAAEILADEQVKVKFQEDSKLKLVSYILKNHKKNVIEIMARLDGEDPATYKYNVNLLTLPRKTLEVLNDPELVNLFTSQAQESD